MKKALIMAALAAAVVGVQADSIRLWESGTATFTIDTDHTLKASGTWKSGATTVTLSWDGTLTVSGTGAMADYDYPFNLSPWYDFKTAITGLVIENGVTHIGNGAFDGCRSLTSVAIGDGVTAIGEYAFINCHSLTSVTIPKSVASIGRMAFASCINLTTITVLNPRPPELGSEVFFNTGCYKYVPARSYFAYRAADGWKEFKHVKVFFTAYEVIALGILSALLLSAAVFVIVKKTRKAKA